MGCFYTWRSSYWTSYYKYVSHTYRAISKHNKKKESSWEENYLKNRRCKGFEADVAVKNIRVESGWEVWLSIIIPCTFSNMSWMRRKRRKRKRRWTHHILFLNVFCTESLRYWLHQLRRLCCKSHHFCCRLKNKNSELQKTHKSAKPQNDMKEGTIYTLKPPTESSVASRARKQITYLNGVSGNPKTSNPKNSKP